MCRLLKREFEAEEVNIVLGWGKLVSGSAEVKTSTESSSAGVISLCGVGFYIIGERRDFRGERGELFCGIFDGKGVCHWLSGLSGRGVFCC